MINNLNPYKGRHDINLSINTKQLGCADQTPTPTTLLNKCDEVGLNLLNPFEETFRKAVEAGLHREPKESHVNIADDTLHTPNVFPIGNEFQHFKEANYNGRVSKVSNVSEDLLKNTKKCIRPKKKVRYVEQSTQSENNFVVLDKNVTFKLPIPKLPPSVKVVSANSFSVLFKNTFKVKQSTERTTPNKAIVDDDKFNLLESNRLAQKRSREKRKTFYKELLQKNLELEEKVTSLTKENISLKRKLELKNTYFKHNELLQLNNNSSIEKERTKPDADVAQGSTSVLLDNPGNLCLESCLSISETKESVTASTNQISQVVLRKPFKKRDIHPKLYLSCKPV